MLQFCVVLISLGAALAAPEPARGYVHHGYHGYGHPAHPKCVHDYDTITVKACHFEPEEACTSETKVVGERVTYSKECKEIDVEVCPHHGHHGHHGHGYHGRHGYHGKRSADDAGYEAPKCETVKKEVCKPVPVKEPVEKEVETCTHTKKEVCEDVEKKVPKVTCEKLKY